MLAIFDFPDGNNGEDLGEEEVEHAESGETADGDGPFDPGGDVTQRFTTGGKHGHEGRCEGRHDDHISFDPHPDVDEDRSGKNSLERSGPGQRQQNGGDQQSDDGHSPEEIGVSAEEERFEKSPVRSFRGIAHGDVFADGEVDVNEIDRQQQGGEFFENAESEIAIEMGRVIPNEGSHGGDEGGDAGENGSDDEVGSEDRAMPAGAEGHAEDPGDDGVDGYGDGDDDDGHGADSALQATPLVGGTGPTDGHEPVKPAAPASQS